jgi:hypothetical protein
MGRMYNFQTLNPVAHRNHWSRSALFWRSALSSYFFSEPPNSPSINSRYKNISFQRRQKHKLQPAISLKWSTEMLQQYFYQKKTRFSTYHTQASSFFCVFERLTAQDTCSLTVTSLSHLVRKSFFKWHIVSLLAQMYLCGHQRAQHPRRVWSYHALERFGTTVSSGWVIQGSNVDHSPTLFSQSQTDIILNISPDLKSVTMLQYLVLTMHKRLTC